jgi:hypothetical protein
VNSPYDYFSGSTASTTLTPIFVSCRALPSIVNEFAWLAGAYALRTEDLGSTMSGATACMAMATARSPATIAPRIRRLRRTRRRLGARCSRWARAEQRRADYDSDAAAFPPNETMFGGSLSLRRAL